MGFGSKAIVSLGIFFRPWGAHKFYLKVKTTIQGHS